MVYRRVIDEQAVAFGHQGSVWQGAMVIYDHLTGSIWSQPYGKPIMGDLGDDVELELLPSTMTTWAEWRQAHPDSLAYQSDYRYTTRYEQDGTVLADSTIVAKYFGESVSYPITTIRGQGVIRDVVGGLEIAVAASESSSESLWNVFAVELEDGTQLDLAMGSEGSSVVDETTGTEWDLAHGYGISGPLSTQRLVILPASMIFADEFLDYYPDGRIWQIRP